MTPNPTRFGVILLFRRRKESFHAGDLHQKSATPIISPHKFAKFPDIWYTSHMNAHTKDGIPNLRESAERLLWQSALLPIETKAALLRMIEQGMDTERLSSIVSILRNEKRYTIAYFQHLLKTNRFPKKIPDLMGNLRHDYFAQIMDRESKEKLDFIHSDILWSLDDVL